MPGESQQRVAADRCGRGVCGERDWRSAWCYEQLVYNVVVQDASSSGTCIYVSCVIPTMYRREYDVSTVPTTEPTTVPT